MLSRQMIVVSRFITRWKDHFDEKIGELCDQIGAVDTRENIDNCSEVYDVETREVIPYHLYRPPTPFVDAFDFVSILN